jgi:pimeloyl-ACP methyl ester carboxylesterase
MKAAEAWPKCAQTKGRSGTQCAHWSEGDVSFRLIRIGRGERTTPVIESQSVQPRPDRIVLYLNGGPDMWPFAYLPDGREAMFRVFYGKRFKVASIAYWGTSFRTNLEKGEIEAASRDLQATYNHYAQRCGCRPLVVAESLGASVLFYTLRQHPKAAYRFVAMSPAMRGLQEALMTFEETTTPKERVFGARRSYLYVRANSQAFSYSGPRLVQSFEHMKSFAGQEDNAFAEHLLDDRCSRVIMGSEDHLNRKYRPPIHERILVLPGLGHNLDLDADLKSTRTLLEQAIGCHVQQSRAGGGGAL